MKSNYIIYLIFSLLASLTYGQSDDYQKLKAEKIEIGSVFTKIINRELPAQIVYLLGGEKLVPMVSQNN